MSAERWRGQREREGERDAAGEGNCSFCSVDEAEEVGGVMEVGVGLQKRQKEKPRWRWGRREREKERDGEEEEEWEEERARVPIARSLRLGEWGVASWFGGHSATVA